MRCWGLPFVMVAPKQLSAVRSFTATARTRQEGKADILEVAGPANLSARLVVQQATHLPVMLIDPRKFEAQK
jgi:hypothetical protein